MSNFYDLIDKHGLPIDLCMKTGYLVHLEVKTPKGHFLGWLLNQHCVGQDFNYIPLHRDCEEGWEIYDEKQKSTLCPTCGQTFSKIMMLNGDNKISGV